MKTVAFYQPFMNERGTCVAMFDYAYYNEKLLGNKSIFIYDSLDIRNEEKGLNRIKQNFDTYDIRCANYDKDNPVTRTQKIDTVLENTNTGYIYMCKSGYNDGVIPTKAKVLVHIMGMVDPSHKHGDVWAYVSYFSNNSCGGGKFPVLPYMATLPNIETDMRESLSIPKHAVVIGRHGGSDTFDIPWAPPVVYKALNDRPNLYFLFLNTPQYINHPRAIYLNSIVDLNEKTSYINTCDSMLHARAVGETFGMACAEFSIRNKPVMTYFDSPERNHIDILGDKGLYYSTPGTLYTLLMSFTKNSSIDWNCYKEYSPDKIMKIFNDLFLSLER